ncbi:ribonuclease H-like domain-containing protein [Vararia minispora EC-137]|uniref:Ribonuclease H-like domain-containing protein n=1 Tax=Vararia minispora EC-137 TaxID=1314806 RepID=A0ACB8Q5X1_9AGAM|nr:ribonuclease H-like domain-containing protein [Vararia minispora EC-137]
MSELSAACAKKLSTLRRLISTLPSSLLLGLYAFEYWSPNPDLLDRFGDAESVFNHDLEVAFAPKGRSSGACPFEIMGRGPGLMAVVEIFSCFLSVDSPSAIIEKWVDDLLSAIQVRDLAQRQEEEESEGRSVYDLDHEDDDDDGNDGEREDHNSLGVSSEDKDTHPAKQRKTRLDDSSMPIQRMLQGNVLLAHGKKAKPTVRTSTVGSTRKRKQTKKADSLPPMPAAYDDFELASENETKETLTGRTVGRKKNDLLHQLAKPCRRKGQPNSKKLLRCIGMTPADKSAGCTKTYAWASGALGRDPAYAYVPEPWRQMAKDELGDKSPSEKKRKADKNLQDAKDGPGTLVPHINRARTTALTTSLDVQILKCVSIGNLSFHFIDSEEWKGLFTIAAPSYFPPSSTRIRDGMLPSEAAGIVAENINYLKTLDNLTLLFDGSTSHAQDSIYTFHVLTPERESFLIKGSSMSAESHTGAHLATEAIKLLNAADVCHRFHNTSKDIAKLSVFNMPIQTTKHAIKFFSKSTLAKTAFKCLMPRHRITRGLQKFGKTRFGSISHSVSSMQRCLPIIHELVRTRRIKLPVANVHARLVPESSKGDEFKRLLKLTVDVFAPCAKTITCAESTHANLADVFMLWLAVSAAYKDLMEDPIALAELDQQTREKIRRILNYRFQQMVENPSVSIDTNNLKHVRMASMYVVAFVLHPSGAQNMNTAFPSLQSKADIYDDVKNFLINQLRIQYEMKKKIDNVSGKEALIWLKAQLHAYVSRSYPFNLPLSKQKSPLNWWYPLLKDPQASVLAFLAIKLFSVVPNSMADERTGSAMTKVNSADQNNLKPETIIHLIQLRQHYMRQRTQKTKHKHIPMVKFYELDKILHSSDGLKEIGPQVSVLAEKDSPVVGNDDEESRPPVLTGDTMSDSLSSDDEGPGPCEEDKNTTIPTNDLEMAEAYKFNAEEWLQDGLLDPTLLNMLSDAPHAVHEDENTVMQAEEGASLSPKADSDEEPEDWFAKG